MFIIVAESRDKNILKQLELTEHENNKMEERLSTLKKIMEKEKEERM